MTRLAAVAAVAVTGGAGTMLFALVADPGPWWRGYVSEAGTAGQPYAVGYRWGLILLALGVALLGVAVRPRHGSATDRPSSVIVARPYTATAARPAFPAAARPAFPTSARLGRLAPTTALCLMIAAVLAATSAIVPCSDRCPLPPYESTTLADVVHTAASILGMVLLAGAMAATWLTGPRVATQRLAAVAVTLTVPLGGTLGLVMVFVGRSQLGANLERVILVVAVSWLFGTALLTGTRHGYLGDELLRGVDRGYASGGRPGGDHMKAEWEPVRIAFPEDWWQCT